MCNSYTCGRQVYDLVSTLLPRSLSTNKLVVTVCNVREVCDVCSKDVIGCAVIRQTCLVLPKVADLTSEFLSGGE